MQAVLQAVEHAADHQSPIGGLDEDVDEEDQGIVVGRQAATGDRRQQRASVSKAVDDSAPMDVLRRAQATAEAAAGAAMAVVSAAIDVQALCCFSCQAGEGRLSDARPETRIGH
jgi:hypothetical protein